MSIMDARDFHVIINMNKSLISTQNFVFNQMADHFDFARVTNVGTGNETPSKTLRKLERNSINYSVLRRISESSQTRFFSRFQISQIGLV